MLSFILVITGVFIYNLRQPSTAKKKSKEKNQERELSKRSTREADSGAKEETGEMTSKLRRALFESQTYEMSDDKEDSADADHTQPGAALPTSSSSKPNGLARKLASKLISKLPSQPTPATQSGLGSSSKRKMRSFEDLAEEERGDGGFFHASTEGLIGERRSSNGSEGAASYGSVDKNTSGHCTTAKRTTRSSHSPPPPEIDHNRGH